MAGVGTALLMLIGLIHWIGRIALGILFLSGLFVAVFKAPSTGLMMIGGAVVGFFLLNMLAAILGGFGMFLVERGIKGH